MAEKKKQKLNNRIIVRCVLMAAAICIAVCVSGYFQYRDSIYHTYNNFGYQLGEVALGYIDGDTVADYIVTGETDEKYDRMADLLYNLYYRSKITSVYICIPDESNNTVTTVYDARIHDAENPEIYALGVVDPIGSNAQAVINIYKTGERSSDYFIRKNSFGYNTSAIMPIKNSAGDITALIVVDIPMLQIEENLFSYLAMTIAITVVIVVAFIALLQLMLVKRIIEPLGLITSEASEFIRSENVISEKLASIKTNDEIETLAESVLQMENDINNYIDNLTAVTAEKERIGAELNVATHIQASMLPCIFPAFPDRKEFDIFASMTPAKEVGGDFYDFFMVDDDHIALVMADVSGKGVPAALFMVIAKTLIKNRTQMGGSPSEILSYVNEQLCEGNEAELFVTVWLGILEISTGKGIAANAGHEHPTIRRAGGKYELIKTKHSPAVAAMEGMRFREHDFELHPGDSLFVYTDGVAEATNTENELFGTDRMLEALNENPDLPVEDILKNVSRHLNEFVGEAPQFDDITMLAFKMNL